MKINPGGRLDTKDVVGRDDEISRYWQVLDRQGLVLSAERRIGKTHIVLKMRDECRNGYLPFYQDLEGVHSITDLIHSIYGAIQSSSNSTRKLKPKFAKLSSLLPNKFAGVEMPTPQQTWPVLLSGAFNELFRIANDQVVLLLWDEFPLMLYNLQRREGSDLTIQLLDFLRSLRVTHASRLRFLFTGSIGLHLVLRSLREAGNTNDPVNDMLSLTVPPIARHDAQKLSSDLLEEIRPPPAEISEMAAKITAEVGGFPYYIHHVVDQLYQMQHAPSLNDVATAIDSILYSPHDPANLRYYETRLSSFYSQVEQTRALMVLDTLAGTSSAISVPELLNLCRHRSPFEESQQIRETLTTLVEDHYIEPKRTSTELAYDFRWPLVKKWWKETRL